MCNIVQIGLSHLAASTISIVIVVVEHIDVSHLFRKGHVLLHWAIGPFKHKESRYIGGAHGSCFRPGGNLQHEQRNFHESRGGCRSVVGTVSMIRSSLGDWSNRPHAVQIHSPISPESVPDGRIDEATDGALGHRNRNLYGCHGQKGAGEQHGRLGNGVQDR